MNIEELIAKGVAATGLGAGVAFTLTPDIITKISGLDLGSGAGRSLLWRVIGARDFAFGLAILLNDGQPKEAAKWLNAFGWCIVADGVASTLALRQKDANKMVVLIAVQSFVIGGAAVFAANRLAKKK